MRNCTTRWIRIDLGGVARADGLTGNGGSPALEGTPPTVVLGEVMQALSGGKNPKNLERGKLSTLLRKAMPGAPAGEGIEQPYPGASCPSD